LEINELETLESLQLFEVIDSMNHFNVAGLYDKDLHADQFYHLYVVYHFSWNCPSSMLQVQKTELREKLNSASDALNETFNRSLISIYYIYLSLSILLDHHLVWTRDPSKTVFKATLLLPLGYPMFVILLFRYSYWQKAYETYSTAVNRAIPCIVEGQLPLLVEAGKHVCG